jgi:hypothetical protein
MYIVRNSKGEAIAIATRKQDAIAMTQTVGTESPKKVDIEHN